MARIARQTHDLPTRLRPDQPVVPGLQIEHRHVQRGHFLRHVHAQRRHGALTQHVRRNTGQDGLEFGTQGGQQALTREQALQGEQRRSDSRRPLQERCRDPAEGQRRTDEAGRHHQGANPGAMAVGKQRAQRPSEGFRHEHHVIVTSQRRRQRIGERGVVQEPRVVVGQHVDIGHVRQCGHQRCVQASGPIQSRQQAEPWPVRRFHQTRSSGTWYCGSA